MAVLLKNFTPPSEDFTVLLLVHEAPEWIKDYQLLLMLKKSFILF